MNKKGSLLDIMMLGIILLVVSMTTIVCYNIYSSINSEIQDSDLFPDGSKEMSNTMEAHFSGVIDNSFLFITIGLAIVAFIMASLVRVHPVFLVLYLVMLVAVIFFAGIFSNIYQEFAANPEFAAEAAGLTFTSHIMNYLPLITGIFGSLLAIIMYKSWREGV